jgi:Ser/Thr protein kinase RdoA (MazF antagonist)
MKLTKKEMTEIAKIYNLGNVVSVRVISGGWNNYNFYLKTEKGNFIVRGLGREQTSKRKKQIKLEFNVLEYLNKKEFPYEIPIPIKSIKNNYIFKIKNKNVWVYKRINGYVLRSLNQIQLRNMIKALAIYHKTIRNFPLKNKKEENQLRGLKKEFIEMKKIKPKNKSEVIIQKNVDMMINILERIKDKKFEQNLLLIHLDFHKKNILYKDNGVMGILDFENLVIAPRIRDIAYLIKTTIDYGKKRFIKKVKFIIREYDKVNPLSRPEKEDILLILARDSCIMFDYYSKSKSLKVDDGDYSCLNWTINTAKQIVRELGWGSK